jgi:predicted RNA polymerase sigma factor
MPERKMALYMQTHEKLSFKDLSDAFGVTEGFAAQRIVQLVQQLNLL